MAKFDETILMKNYETPSSKSQLKQILKNFIGRSGAIGSIIIEKSSGLTVESFLPSDIDEDVVSAMGSAMLSMSFRSINELEQGNFQHVLTEGSKGYTCIFNINDETLLLVLCNKMTKLGLILLEGKRSIQEIRNIMEKEEFI